MPIMTDRADAERRSEVDDRTRSFPLDIRQVIAIAMNPDAEVRNHQIVLAYNEMGRRLDPILHKGLAQHRPAGSQPTSDDGTGRVRASNANWFTVATWAINTVGTQIRNRELPRRLEQVVPNSLRSQAEPWILSMRSSAGQRVARALGDGQTTVFASTMLQGVRFLERHLSEELGVVAERIDRVTEFSTDDDDRSLLWLRLASTIKAFERSCGTIDDGAAAPNVIDLLLHASAEQRSEPPKPVPDETVNRLRETFEDLASESEQTHLDADVTGRVDELVKVISQFLWDRTKWKAGTRKNREQLEVLLETHERLIELIWLQPAWAGWASPRAHDLLLLACEVNARIRWTGPKPGAGELVTALENYITYRWSAIGATDVELFRWVIGRVMTFVGLEPALEFGEPIERGDVAVGEDAQARLLLEVATGVELMGRARDIEESAAPLRDGLLRASAGLTEPESIDPQALFDQLEKVRSTVDKAIRPPTNEDGDDPYEPDEEATTPEIDERADELAQALLTRITWFVASRDGWDEVDPSAQLAVALDIHRRLIELAWLHAAWKEWAEYEAECVLGLAQQINLSIDWPQGGDPIGDRLRRFIADLWSSVDADHLELLRARVKAVCMLFDGHSDTRPVQAGELRSLLASLVRSAEFFPEWGDRSSETRGTINDAIAELEKNGGAASTETLAGLQQSLKEAAEQARNGAVNLKLADPCNGRRLIERIADLRDEGLVTEMRRLGVEVDPGSAERVRWILRQAFGDPAHDEWPYYNDVEAGFGAYERASRSEDQQVVAAEIFRGNLIIAAVEQVLLDEAVTTVAEHVPDEFREWVEWRSSRWLDNSLDLPRPFSRMAVANRMRNVNSFVKQTWARILTRQVLVVAFPTELVRVGQDIPEQRRRDLAQSPDTVRFYPDDLADLPSEPPAPDGRVGESRADELSTRAMFEMYDRSRGDGRGTGARDWRRFDERLNFAANLLRSRQQDHTLFWKPYNREDRERIAAGRLPHRTGDPFAGQVLAPAQMESEQLL